MITLITPSQAKLKLGSGWRRHSFLFDLMVLLARAAPSDQTKQTTVPSQAKLKQGSGWYYQASVLEMMELLARATPSAQAHTLDSTIPSLA